MSLEKGHRTEDTEDTEVFEGAIRVYGLFF